MSYGTKSGAIIAPEAGGGLTVHGCAVTFLAPQVTESGIEGLDTWRGWPEECWGCQVLVRRVIATGAKPISS